MAPTTSEEHFRLYVLKRSNKTELFQLRCTQQCERRKRIPCY